MATKDQIKRTNKLIDFLLAGVHRKKFDLKHWVGGIKADSIEDTVDPVKMGEDPTTKPTCNTSACVMGWFPHLFPKMTQWVKYSEHRPSWQVFGIGKNDYLSRDQLFSFVTGIKNSNRIIYVEYSNYRYNNNQTPQVVAKRIMKIAKDEGIELGR